MRTYLANWHVLISDGDTRRTLNPGDVAHLTLTPADERLLVGPDKALTLIEKPRRRKRGST